MFFGNFISSLHHLRRSSGPRASRELAAAAACAVMEGLDSRRLLSTVTYYVPSSIGGSPVTYVKLQHDVSPGIIDVYLNNSTSYSYQFTNTSGTDVIQSGSPGAGRR